MTPTLTALVLSAALLHAIWNAMAKSGGEPGLSIASYQLIGCVICLLGLPLVPTPDPGSWKFIFSPVVIHNLYYFSLAKAYRCGDLSQVYPLVRGLAPVLVKLGAAVFAGEWLPPGVIVGIALLSTGVVSLAFMGRHLGEMSPGARSRQPVELCPVAIRVRDCAYWPGATAHAPTRVGSVLASVSVASPRRRRCLIGRSWPRHCRHEPWPHGCCFFVT